MVLWEVVLVGGLHYRLPSEEAWSVPFLLGVLMPPTARLLVPLCPTFTGSLATSATLPATVGLLAFSAEAKSSLIEELMSYGKRGDNWDGKGAEAPLAGDIEAALRFLSTYPDGFLLPGAMLYSAGDVALYWEKGEGYADLEFYRGEVSLYTNGVADGYQKDELIVNLVAEDLTLEWVEEELGFFKGP